MTKNKLVSTVVAVSVVVGLGAFYGGYIYGRAGAVGQRQAMRGQFGQPGQGASRMMQGGGFTAGEVISKDEQSITLKSRDGGSKIIFTSANTEISKFASGSMGDLNVGSSISVTGKANADGSIVAETIQLRPAGLMMGPPAGR